MESENNFICDPQLSELKDKIKQVMIPLMIRVFELKLTTQLVNCPTSRLINKPEQPTDEIRLQLEQLKEDLKLLLLWVQSCQKQVDKTLAETEIKLFTIQKELCSSAINHTQKSSFIWHKNGTAK